jgi:hypothetical protein
MSDFGSMIKEWVKLDNHHKTLNKQVSELRDVKKNLCTRIIDTAKDNNYESAVIQISDGRLQFKEKKDTSPLTIKYVKECIDAVIDDDELAKELMDYIKSNRTTKTHTDIMRYYAE